MSELVKTGKEIIDEDSLLVVQGFTTGKPNIKKLAELSSAQYLVLPLGLDVLEEMLKEELKNHNWRDISIEEWREIGIIVSSVFARFKKEHGGG